LAYSVNELDRENMISMGITIDFFHYKCEIPHFIRHTKQCQKCFNFGHDLNSCSNNKKCRNCSSTEHEIKDCEKNYDERTCGNCGGNHRSSYLHCPSRIDYINNNPIRRRKSILKRNLRADTEVQTTPGLYNSQVNYNNQARPDNQEATKRKLIWEDEIEQLAPEQTEQRTRPLYANVLQNEYTSTPTSAPLPKRDPPTRKPRITRSMACPQQANYSQTAQCNSIWEIEDEPVQTTHINQPTEQEPRPLNNEQDYQFISLEQFINIMECFMKYLLFSNRRPRTFTEAKPYLQYLMNNICGWMPDLTNYADTDT
jgi:hypothetical protein